MGKGSPGKGGGSEEGNSDFAKFPYDVAIMLSVTIISIF